MNKKCIYCEDTGLVVCVTCGKGPCQPINERSICAVGVVGEPCTACKKIALVVLQRRAIGC